MNASKVSRTIVICRKLSILFSCKIAPPPDTGNAEAGKICQNCPQTVNKGRMRRRSSDRTNRKSRARTPRAAKDGTGALQGRTPRSAGRKNRGRIAAAPPGRQGEAFWIYGRHPVMAALANPRRRCLRLLGTPEALGTLDLPPALPRENRPRQDIDVLTGSDSPHQGLALEVLPLAENNLEETCTPRGHDLIVVLDRITDPHNAGAILRSAAAFGARAEGGGTAQNGAGIVRIGDPVEDDDQIVAPGGAGLFEIVFRQRQNFQRQPLMG